MIDASKNIFDNIEYDYLNITYRIFKTFDKDILNNSNNFIEYYESIHVLIYANYFSISTFEYDKCWYSHSIKK